MVIMMPVRIIHRLHFRKALLGYIARSILTNTEITRGTQNSVLSELNLEIFTFHGYKTVILSPSDVMYERCKNKHTP